MSRGAETTHQNAVYIGAQFAETVARRMSDLNKPGKAVFAYSGVPSQLDILRHEIVFAFKNDGSGKQYTKARVLSSLSGAGEHIVNQFPDDPALQRDVLLEHLQILGTSDQDIEYATVANNSADSGRDFQIQQVGIANQVSVEPMVVGGKLEYYLPETYPMRGPIVSASNGRTPNKATVELRHFTPALAGEYIANRLQAMIFDESKWQLMTSKAGSQTPFSRTGPAWLACANAWKAMSGLTGLLFLYRIVGYLAESYGQQAIKWAFPAGVATPTNEADALANFEAQFKKEFNTDGSNTKAQPYTSYKHGTYPLLSLARKLGIADANSQLFPETNTLVFDSLEKSKYAQDVMRQFYGSLLWKGAHRELGFGLNHEAFTNQNSPFSGPAQALHFDNTFGNLLHKQKNVPKIFFSAVTQMVSFRMANIAGTVTRGTSTAGELFAYNKAV